LAVYQDESQRRGLANAAQSAHGLEMPEEGLQVLSRSRVLIRTRGSGATLSAWRVELTLPQGNGTIVLAEVGKEQAWYRGEGVLLGAPQERLAELWKASLPDPEPEQSVAQWG
jgi:hypothetical protein